MSAWPRTSSPAPARGARAHVLIIEDDEAAARPLRSALRGEGRELLVCVSMRETLSLLPEVLPDLVVLSLDLSEAPGARAIEILRDRLGGAPIVGLTSRPSLELGVAAMQAGAHHVLARPPSPRQLSEIATAAIEIFHQTHQLARQREQSQSRHGFSHMLTQSPRMLGVFDQIRSVASTDATVLILGETGTGKELVSRAIHERSRRKDRPFIGVNCGAFTETLLESELFGHEKGSFTGASGRREGVFEMADGGTLFLDELGETTPSVQVNLLRVLEEMTFRRVGGHDLVHVDVRILAATHVDLEGAVAEKRFRQDLYYRLNVFPIHLPPLRERPEDIPLLTRHFLESAAQDYDLDPPIISPEAMECIAAYRWPGNVRQLRSLCERWVIAARGRSVGLDLLPATMKEAPPSAAPATPAEPLVDEAVPMALAVERAAARIEKAYLTHLLGRLGGRLAQTAEAAGITRRTLYSKLKAYDIDPERFKPSIPGPQAPS
jgi:DNA-binding NtrC family response regulator